MMPSRPGQRLGRHWANARSISPASVRLTGVTSSPSDGAMAWITANMLVPEPWVGSRTTATRVTLGAISLSSASHFPLKLYSSVINPVALPPGRARLSTRPAPTGSAMTGNTIGTVRVVCSNGRTVEVPYARITSGPSATNSAACLRMSSALAPAQRVSIRTLRPMIQPDCTSACWKAPTQA